MPYGGFFLSTATRPVYRTGPSHATPRAMLRGLRPSFVPPACIAVFLVLCRGALRAWAPPFKRPSPLYQGPSLQPGFALQVISAYLAPSAPLAISPQFPCLAGYMGRLCCAAAWIMRRPRPMTSGSRLSKINPSWHATLYDPGEFETALFQSRGPNMAFAYADRGSALPSNLRSASRRWGFTRLPGSLLLRPVKLLAPCADLTGVSQPSGLLLPGFRRVDHPSRRWI